MDIDNYETPLMAFRNTRAADETQRGNPNWMGTDIDG